MLHAQIDHSSVFIGFCTLTLSAIEGGFTGARIPEFHPAWAANDSLSVKAFPTAELMHIPGMYIFPSCLSQK